MFAFAAAIVLGAFTLASCGDDDDNSNTTRNNYSLVWSFETKRTGTAEVEKEKQELTEFVNETNATYSKLPLNNTLDALTVWSMVVTREMVSGIQKAVDEMAEEHNDPTIVITLKLMNNNMEVQKQVWRPKNWDII